MTTFRERLKDLGPNWLVRDRVTTPDGTTTEVDSRTLWPIMFYFDATYERIARGIRARFPGGGAPADALGYIGRDRMVVRGPAETRASYELRLQRYLDDLRLAGGAWAVLEQLRAYCTPHAVKVSLVNNHGRWRTIERDGTRSRENVSEWDWDGLGSAAWSRYWILIYMTLGTPQQPWARLPGWGDPDLWGGAWGDPTASFGSTATQNDIQAIRRICSAPWKHGGSRLVNICVCFDETLAPDEAAPPLPDGTWGNWSKNVGGVQVPARDPSAIYWKGTS